MIKKIYYEKRGRKYVPVSEYDSGLLDALPKGAHLVLVYPGGRSTRYNIDPNYAALIAASRVAEDAVSETIRRATELRPVNRELTERDHQRWLDFIKTMPEDMRFMMTHGSAREAAEAGVKALMEEAEKLMTNPAVKKAFERFLFVCQLTKESERSNEQ